MWYLYLYVRVLKFFFCFFFYDTDLVALGSLHTHIHRERKKMYNVYRYITLIESIIIGVGGYGFGTRTPYKYYALYTGEMYIFFFLSYYKPAGSVAEQKGRTTGP